MKPLYIPKGKAKEYGDYAVNIYTGCPHRCFYCFAPNVLHKDKKKFHCDVRPREGIVDALRRQLEREKITGKLVHLCFTCDPYPTGYDSSTTREVITALKAYGNHIQILTKGSGFRDFDLLDSEDWYGITLDGSKNINGVEPTERIGDLILAHTKGIKTWVSFEPVIDRLGFFTELHVVARFVDKVKIGKLNYHKSDIDWNDFGYAAETVCKMLGVDYYIKESLRAEMREE